MEGICSSETQHSQFGKMSTLSPRTTVWDYWICHGHQSVLSWKKWTITVMKGAMVDSRWWCEQSTLGFLTIHIAVRSLLPSTPPCNWKSCIQSRGPPKRMPNSQEILINWSITPLTHRHKRFAQKELFSTLCSTCLTWFRGLSVEKRINGWPGQKEYTRHTFVLLFEIEVKM